LVRAGVVGFPGGLTSVLPAGAVRRPPEKQEPIKVGQRFKCTYVKAILDTRRQRLIVSEIGTDMSCFPSADHWAAWAGVAPSNNESAGKRRSGKTRKGNRPLCAALNQAANAASHTKATYLSAQYHCLAGRRGKKKAIVAVEHSILVFACHVIKRKEPYREL
jgi:transposase